MYSVKEGFEWQLVIFLPGCIDDAHFPCNPMQCLVANMPDILADRSPPTDISDLCFSFSLGRSLSAPTSLCKR